MKTRQYLHVIGAGVVLASWPGYSQASDMPPSMDQPVQLAAAGMPEFVAKGMIQAARDGQTDMLIGLVGAGHSPDAVLTEDGQKLTPLRVAAEHGHTLTVSALLAQGATVDAADGDGLTALMYAAKGGYLEVVKVLVDAGANPNAQDASGKTALAYAVMSGNDDIVTALKTRAGTAQLVTEVTAEPAPVTAAAATEAIASEPAAVAAAETTVADAEPAAVSKPTVQATAEPTVAAKPTPAAEPATAEPAPPTPAEAQTQQVAALPSATAKDAAGGSGAMALMPEFAVMSLKEFMKQKPDAAQMYAKAQAYIGEGELDSASVLYEFAAAKGHGGAALALATFYDPVTFDKGKSPFSRPNPVKAAEYYIRAVNSGSTVAAKKIAALKTWAETESAGGDRNAERALKIIQ